MDNVTYNDLSLIPINTDETYSRLRATETKIEPSYGHQRRADIAQRGEKKNNSSNNTKFNVAIITIIVVLLLISLTSIALSVITFTRLASEQSSMLKQVPKSNDDINTAEADRLDTIEKNLSQNVWLLLETQCITAQTNLSQNLDQLENKLEMYILMLTEHLKVQTQINCGPGLWHRLVSLNMSDPSQQCPSAWREYNTDGVRACGRPVNSSGSCAAIYHSTDRQYSRVCGRVIGYQFATPGAFQHHENSNNIDLDGINITHGANHDHIWSYVAGYRNSSQHSGNCPCFNNNDQGTNPPSSIGDNYYCESGNPTNGPRATLYTNDPLWDGKQCEGTCCTGTKSPPWFSVQLPAPTTDAIEVSICCDEGTSDEDVPVELIEIYVQ